MSLTKYKQKRSFTKTPEPTGGKSSAKELMFVIQKHAASRLHYDFRLEMDGVLKSWAVPKGPSTNPADKRLAMMVEDHPFDYRDFEGVIPEGNYGAGTVIVWDTGTYEPLVPVKNKKEAEKEMLKELKTGSVKINMHGKKMKGEYALVHTHGRGENSWLLIKHRDKYASESDITAKDKSVISGKSLEKMTSRPDRIYGKTTVAKNTTEKDKPSGTKGKAAAQIEKVIHPAGLGKKPGTAKPGTAKPGTAKPGTTKPRTAKPGTAKPGAKKSAAKSAAESSSAKSTSPKSASPTKATKKNASAKSATVKSAGGGAAAKKKIADLKPEDGKKSPIPKTVSPMLATLVDKPFDEPGWIYEIKWDGYRAVAICKKDSVELLSRNNKSFNEKFYPVHDALKNLGFDAVLDGEIAVVKEDGITNFGALQNWRSEADGELVYYVFDLLWLNGYSLMDLPLTARREKLHALLPDEGIVRESESFDTSATDFLAAAGKMGLEGIIAKKADSTYRPGDRGRDWIKIKIQHRHEVVIGGYTKNEDSPKLFSALLVGVFDGKRLNYTGKIGTGFNDKKQKEMMALFKPLLQDKAPFTEIPDVNKPSRFRPDPPHAKAFWLKPALVCEVSYTEMTSDGVMRHPSFEGMREDKAASDVHAEVAAPTENVVEEQSGGNAKKKQSGAGAKKTPGAEKTPGAIASAAATADSNPPARKKSGTKGGEKMIAAAPQRSTAAAKNPVQPMLKGARGERKTLLNPSEETQVKSINGHELKFGHLSKLYWPKDGFTKRDMLNYYYQIAPYILPYLVDRPQSLNRFPNGIDGKSFYQKDVTASAPEWVKQFPYHTAEGEDKNFLVVEDEASLLWMATGGAIEMNPWNSTIKTPDNPDWCIIDLDPTEKNSFDQVVETARATREVLEGMKITGYPKTSGSTGIHIYIPMGARYSYDECQMFARLIATRVHEMLPSFTSIERMTNKRKGKIYVDFLQNRPKATLAAPYSVRPKPGATVSMPLHWEEVKKGLKMTQFTIQNALARVKSVGDLYKPVLGKGADIEKAIRQLEKNQ